MTDSKYTFMSRKELSFASGLTERTLYDYINKEWHTLENFGCKPYKRLTPAAVKYLCERYEIHL